MRTLLFFLLLGIISCKKDAMNTGNNNGSSILPLAVGNQWRYQITTIDSTATAPNPIYKVDTVVIECNQTIVEHGTTYHRLSASKWFRGSYSMIEDLTWINGICHAYDYSYHLNANPPFDKGYAYLQYPSSVGEIWSWNEPYRSYDYTVLAVDTTVNVLGGAFTEAFLVEIKHIGGLGSSADRIEMQRYYQPGVGLVKQVYTEKHVPVLVESVMELIDYTVQ